MDLSVRKYEIRWRFKMIFKACKEVIYFEDLTAQNQQQKNSKKIVK